MCAQFQRLASSHQQHNAHAVSLILSTGVLRMDYSYSTPSNPVKLYLLRIFIILEKISVDQVQNIFFFAKKSDKKIWQMIDPNKTIVKKYAVKTNSIDYVL